MWSRAFPEARAEVRGDWGERGVRAGVQTATALLNSAGCRPAAKDASLMATGQPHPAAPVLCGFDSTPGPSFRVQYVVSKPPEELRFVMRPETSASWPHTILLPAQPQAHMQEGGHPSRAWRYLEEGAAGGRRKDKKISAGR